MQQEGNVDNIPGASGSGMGTPDLSRRSIEIPQLTREKAAFEEAIIGQDEAVDSFAKLLVTLRSGVRRAKPQPLDVKFLAGPSGVGKTEIVYRLAELLGGDPQSRDKVIVLNGGAYKTQYQISQLLGSPPGYIGSKDSRYPGGTEPILSQKNLDSHKIPFKDNGGRSKDAVIILMDEAEKADQSVHQAFLSVLDRGTLQLADNTPVDFRNAVIIFTSNVGNQQVEELRKKALQEATEQQIPEAFRETAGEAMAGQEAKGTVSEAFKMAFPPELRGRIRDLVIFNHLTPATVERIVNLRVRDVEEEFRANGISFHLELSDKARRWLVEKGYNPSEGARALDKVMADSIQTPLTLAQTELGLEGKTVYVDFEKGSDDLSFYLPEKAVSTESDLSSGIRVQLYQQLHSDLRGGGSSLDNYVAIRAKLVKEGLITSPEIANNDIGVQNIIRERLAERLQNIGYEFFYRLLTQCYNAGLINEKELEKVPETKEAAQKLLNSIIDSREPVVLGNIIDLFILAGFGTPEDWEKSMETRERGIFTIRY